jgi:hypothetical protein
MSDTGQGTPVGLEQEPAARSDEDRELAERLAAEARERGLDLVGPEGVLTGPTKRVLEAGLEAELTEHLGYDKLGREPRRRQLPQRHKAEDGADRGRSREVGRAAGSGLELTGSTSRSSRSTPQGSSTRSWSRSATEAHQPARLTGLLSSGAAPGLAERLSSAGTVRHR